MCDIIYFNNFISDYLLLYNKQIIIKFIHNFKNLNFVHNQPKTKDIIRKMNKLIKQVHPKNKKETN